ncbi:phosphatase PAP2 family protein [Aureimonas populi]|uniref:Phosphatase PAP2 family protein n=1 Tax=Aureimonas populi TaxID=1701758 RepID=A0ABW5CNS5_9HYPH|nr:phosphatase PAP2 family protein [Aureimonas populi]
MRPDITADERQGDDSSAPPAKPRRRYLAHPRTLARSALFTARRLSRKARPDAPALVTWPVGALLALLLVSLPFLFAIDEAVGRAMLAEPEGVLSFLRYATDAGLIRWYLYPTLAILLGLWMVEWHELPRSRRLRGASFAFHAGYLLAAVSIAQIVVQVLKRAFGRARPPLLDEYGSLSFSFARLGDHFASFPSGHSSTMAAVTAVAMVWMPALRLPILIVGVSLALTRIVVRAHYPSDVAAGLAIGFATAVVLGRWLAQRGLGYEFRHGGRGLAGLLPVRAGSSAIARSPRPPTRVPDRAAGLPGPQAPPGAG